MKQLIISTLLVFTVYQGVGEHLYLRAGATGAANGSDWNNAWSDWKQVQWGQGVRRLGAGDTLWVAGGHYGSFSPGASGTSLNPILIKRVVQADAIPTAAAGWSGSFDAQVVLSPRGASPMLWNSHVGVGSYLYIDGRTTNGIWCRYDNSPDAFLGAVAFTGNQIHDVTLTNMDLSGPGGADPYNYRGDNAPLIFRSSSPGTDAIYNIKVTHSSLHGGPNLIYSIGPKFNITIDHCRLYDNASANSDIHANVIYNIGGSNWTFSCNDVSGWQVEGIILHENVNTPWHIYGNVFHSPQDPGARCFWLSSPGGTTPQGPVFLYNNTFAGVAVTIGEGNASQFASGSMARNNIYWNASWYSGASINDSDYNFSDSSTPGANSISNGSNPFVDINAKNFHIITNISPTHPHNNGTSLGNPYNVDKDGNIRGANGAWDIGAYEVR